MLLDFNRMLYCFSLCRVMYIFGYNSKCPLLFKLEYVVINFINLQYFDDVPIFFNIFHHDAYMTVSLGFICKFSDI